MTAKVSFIKICPIPRFHFFLLYLDTSSAPTYHSVQTTCRRRKTSTAKFAAALSDSTKRAISIASMNKMLAERSAFPSWQTKYVASHTARVCEDNPTQDTHSVDVRVAPKSAGLVCLESLDPRRDDRIPVKGRR